MHLGSKFTMEEAIEDIKRVSKEFCGGETPTWREMEEHEQMNHPLNLISLCISCHRELDGMFKGRDHEDFEELARDYMGVEGSLKRSIFEY